MNKLMKQLVALMLMVSILAGMLPVEGIAMMQARAQVLTGDTGGHGGGDMGLVKGVISLFANGIPSKSTTYIDKSIESHFVALAAEESRLNDGKVIDMEEWINKF